MIEYKYNKNDYGDIIECYSCGHLAPTYHFAPQFPATVREYICEICANSDIAGRGGYENRSTTKIIGQVANILLDKLTDRTNEKT